VCDYQHRLPVQPHQHRFCRRPSLHGRFSPLPALLSRLRCSISAAAAMATQWVFKAVAIGANIVGRAFLQSYRTVQLRMSPSARAARAANKEAEEEAKLKGPTKPAFECRTRTCTRADMLSPHARMLAFPQQVRPWRNCHLHDRPLAHSLLSPHCSLYTVCVVLSSFRSDEHR